MQHASPKGLAFELRAKQQPVDAIAATPGVGRHALDLRKQLVDVLVLRRNGFGGGIGQLVVPRVQALIAACDRISLVAPTVVVRGHLTQLRGRSTFLSVYDLRAKPYAPPASVSRAAGRCIIGIAAMGSPHEPHSLGYGHGGPPRRCD